MSDELPIEIEGNEITIRFQRIKDPKNPRESIQNHYRAFAYHRSQYFEADDSDKVEALKSIKKQLRRFIEKERNK